MGKRGIALPFQADGRGRLVTIDRDAELSKIINMQLQNMESNNPFQDLGLGEEMIFAVDNDDLQSDLRRRINEIFRQLQLQDRARLEKPPVFSLTAEGELEVAISYIDLETNKIDEFTRVFPGGGSFAAGGV